MQLTDVEVEALQFQSDAGTAVGGENVIPGGALSVTVMMPVPLNGSFTLVTVSVHEYQGTSGGGLVSPILSIRTSMSCWHGPGIIGALQAFDTGTHRPPCCCTVPGGQTQESGVGPGTIGGMQDMMEARLPGLAGTQCPLISTMPDGQMHSPAWFSTIGGGQMSVFTHSPS